MPEKNRWSSSRFTERVRITQHHKKYLERTKDRTQSISARLEQLLDRAIASENNRDGPLDIKEHITHLLTTTYGTNSTDTDN